jgi:hypothetical protein
MTIYWLLDKRCPRDQNPFNETRAMVLASIGSLKDCTMYA